MKIYIFIIYFLQNGVSASYSAANFNTYFTAPNYMKYCKKYFRGNSYVCL